ncbi:MAG TPA: hypothetical protein GXX36_08250 [Clostridiaceae bacterium]|nr:hypothetical protein [Clostridiaceae bacterium]
MNSLEKAFKFAGRYYLLALPLVALYAIPALVGSSGPTASLKYILDSFPLFGNYDYLSDPAVIIGTISSFFVSAMGATILSFILGFIAYPSTYGMINKTLQTGTGDLNDFLPALKQNFVKYLLYWVGGLAVSAVLGIIAIVVFIILGLLTAVLKWFGIMLIVLAFIVFFAVGVVAYVLLSLWFSVMVVDDMDLMQAFKRSIQIAWANFGSLLGIILLVIIVTAIAGGIIGLIVGWIPVLGPVISSLVSAASTFILTIFYIMFYRDKTGREVLI